MLSRSVGDLSTSDLIGLSFKSQNEPSIVFAGYVLKRSNNPWTDSSAATTSLALPSTAQLTQQSSKDNNDHGKATTKTYTGTSTATLAFLPKNRSSVRLDLYNSIRSNRNNNQANNLKPKALSSLLPPQSTSASTSNLKKAHTTEDSYHYDSTTAANNNLTHYPNLNVTNINSNNNNDNNDNNSSPPSSDNSSNNMHIYEATAKNSVSLVASLFENETPSLPSKGKQEEPNAVYNKTLSSYLDLHLQPQHSEENYDNGYSYEEDIEFGDYEEEGYQSALNPSQSAGTTNSSSYLNLNKTYSGSSSLNQDPSSDSSHIPQIPKSMTQPIAIARSTSEDSSDKNYNYNTTFNHHNYLHPGTTTLLPPSNSIQANRNMNQSSNINISRPLAYVRMTSAPVEGANKVYPPPPKDYIDSKDGHLWRAKYCILEDGVLYFYPNAKIGNSNGAKQERTRMSSAKNFNNSSSDINSSGHAAQEYHDNGYGIGGVSSIDNLNMSHDDMMMGDGFTNDESDHLAKSPMPRKSMRMNFLNSNGGGGSNGLNDKEDSFCHDSNVYWEKRVALDKVGNVRSNPDYGERVFELLAINSEEERDRKNGEEVDRLLLRAGSEYEMNCWIFEIHRSFIFLMKQFAEIVGSSYKSAGGYLGGSDRRIPSQTFGSRHSLERFNTSSTVPTTALSNSLSHGHGRSIRRRRSEMDSLLSGDLMDLAHSPEATKAATAIDEGIIQRMRSRSHDSFKDYIPPETLKINIANSGYESETNLTEQLSSSRLTELIESEMPISSPKIIESHIDKVSTTNKYIPPHRRQNKEISIESEVFEQVQLEEEEYLRSSSVTREQIFQLSPDECFEYSEEIDVKTPEVINVSLGGCADPNLIDGTICDMEFIPEKASKVRQSAEIPFGYTLEKSDIGATSTCGVRDSNEDSYLVVNDLVGDSSTTEDEQSYFSSFNKRSLFAIFDGHCGNHAARYSAEKLRDILLHESRDSIHLEKDIPIESILESTISRLDKEFCELCSLDNRDWFSGTTAIIALVLDEKVIVANVGDCRGILCRSSSELDTEGWEILKVDDSDSCTNENTESLDNPLSSEIFWREVASTHSPSQEEEKFRIESANGWTNNSEQEVTIASQFQTIREHLSDEDVRLMFLRWFSDRSDSRHARILNIWRVCGDLAVSRAIGDREYKAAYGEGSLDSWRSTAPFFYPVDHSGLFNGDLIVSTPDINHFRISGDDNVLLLACDGLWDVLDADDAVRLTRKLVFERGLSARESAQRLAELAGHLGSSDNITVIVVRL